MSRIKLSTDRLTQGLYIKLPCSWRHHPFLFSHFKIQDEEQIKILRSLDIKYVIFFPEKSDADPLPPNADKPAETADEELQNAYLKKLWAEKKQRIEEQKRYSRNLRSCEKQFNKSLSIVRAINFKMSSQGAQALVDATELIDSISNKLNSSNHAVLHLMEDGKEGDEYHNHVFHVAILAMILGKAQALSEQELTYLGLGALFHDLGLNKIPKQILRNNPQITAAEKNYFKLHVRYALEQINNIPNFPEPVCEIVSQHHEYLDGSGYPKGLTGDQMLLTGKILSVANAFVALVSPRAYREGTSVEETLDQLMQEAGVKYDRQVLASLFHIAENRKDWSEWINEA